MMASNKQTEKKPSDKISERYELIAIGSIFINAVLFVFDKATGNGFNNAVTGLSTVLFGAYCAYASRHVESIKFNEHTNYFWGVISAALLALLVALLANNWIDPVSSWIGIRFSDFGSVINFLTLFCIFALVAQIVRLKFLNPVVGIAALDN